VAVAEISSKDKNPLPVVAAEPFNWTGFYIGANVGGIWTDYDFGDYDTTLDVTATLFGPGVFPPTNVGYVTPAIDGGSDESLVGGGQLGYQHQFGHFVAGIEGEFAGMSSSAATTFTSDTQFATEPITGFGTQTNFLTRRKADVNWNASVRGKFGWVPGDSRLMLYVTGGLALADVRTWATDISDTEFFSGPFFVFSRKIKNGAGDDDVLWGGTAGGGIEWAMTDIVSIGAEYRHNWFGDETYNYDNHHKPLVPGSTNIDIDSDQVTLRVNFLLGRMGHAPR
jgi:outer membrane immunogenic protein